MNDDRASTSAGADDGKGGGTGGKGGTDGGTGDSPGPDAGPAADDTAATAAGDGAAPAEGAPEPPPAPAGEASTEGVAAEDVASGAESAGEASAEGDEASARTTAGRRPPALTTDTARPEGGGRAAPGDAPAPARQWPLLTVLSIAGVGLLIVGLDPFAQALRIGTLLVGVALLTGGVLRRVVPSVGMLAVRSRFTDLLTYGLLGVAIVLLALTAQPRPLLELEFLEDFVRWLVDRDQQGAAEV